MYNRYMSIPRSVPATPHRKKGRILGQGDARLDGIIDENDLHGKNNGKGKKAERAVPAASSPRTTPAKASTSASVVGTVVGQILG